MTHDELLKYINEKLSWENNTEAGAAYSALRAVVELHKPYEGESFGVVRQWCTECATEDYAVHYPCTTIQAIEKELG